jgi:hypothetical protein
MKRTLSCLALVALFTIAVPERASATSFIMLGNDTSAPEAMYALNGTFLGSFGPTGATGAAFDGTGHVFINFPLANEIREFDGSATLLSTLTNPRGFNEDMAPGAGNTLYVDENSGEILHIDYSGNVLDSFDLGVFGIGVGFDGTFLYTTAGFTTSSGVITKRQLDGTPVATLDTGFGGSLSLGVDPSDGTYWVGYLGIVRHFDGTGGLIGSFSTPDANFFHDGLEIGSFETTTPVPEPSSLLLLGSGVGGIALAAYRRKKA